MKPLAILALLAFAGCSSAAPMPNVTQPPVEQSASSGCRAIDYALRWRAFRKGQYGIKGPVGFVAVTNAVTNDLSNGIFVRSGEHKSTYAEGSGTYTFITFDAHRPARNVILRDIVGHKPTAGVFYSDISYCRHK